MTLSAIDILPWAIEVTLGMLGLTMFLAFVRLVRGPSLPDRVVALDLIATTTVGMIAVYAVAVREPVFLIAAVVMALITFLGTVAFAYCIEKGGSP